MTLIQLQNVCLSYGTQVLFDNLSYSISEGERICLLGRNGVGKSTLFKLLCGDLKADSGEVQFKNNLIVSKLDQELPQRVTMTAYDYLSREFSEAHQTLTDYHHLTSVSSPTERQLIKLSELQQRIEHQGYWQLEQRIKRWLSEVSLDEDTPLDQLSGGKLRLLSLAKALVSEPDVLLLDEPTNHLDIERIEWLEERLSQWVKSMLFITHDRSFANRLATQIIELDRGMLTTFPGNLDDYFKQKEHLEATEANQVALQDKKLAQEEVWIRQGIKARRTRNEGRVRALKAMREKVSARRNKTADAQIQIGNFSTSGKLVAELSDVTKSYGDKTLFQHLDLTILRGDRLGILGANGSGKSTLIKTILGEVVPDSGKVRLGTKLTTGYFDQRRDDIDLQKSVSDNVTEGNQFITINNRQIHIISYLQQYLFSASRARTPASALSGGELSRLALAKLMSKPFNLLIMDEPTNDLDIETLEVLESQLADYQGTLIVISHDRDFIDNTVSTVLHLDGQGNTTQCVGGYSDWANKYKSAQKPETSESKTDAQSDKVTEHSHNKSNKSRKLSYHQQRELEKLPATIESLEAEFAQLQQQIAGAAFSELPHHQISETYQHLASLEQEINTLYQRWEELTEQ